VRDRRGEFVSDLNKSNFQVYEDKKPQPLSLFQHEDVPATVGLVVDHSGSMAARRLQVIEAAQTFVQVSNPQDHEFVVNFSNSVSLGLPENVAFTNDVNVLLSALSTPTAGGQTALYDALLLAMHHIQKTPDKKALLLISDGGDNASQHKFSDVLRASQESNVTIYAIGLFDENSADQNPQVLRKLADETGGQVYLPNSFAQLLDSAREIAADIRHQYTLGYAPPSPDRGGYRKIRVTVSAPRRGKLYVRTRAGYFLPSRTAPTSAATNGSE
jgi:VWFA-related protein